MQRIHTLEEASHEWLLTQKVPHWYKECNTKDHSFMSYRSNIVWGCYGCKRYAISLSCYHAIRTKVETTYKTEPYKSRVAYWFNGLSIGGCIWCVDIRLDYIWEIKHEMDIKKNTSSAVFYSNVTKHVKKGDLSLKQMPKPNLTWA